jgi:hypothetical protein
VNPEEIAQIKERGPRRVIINAGGSAVGPERAWRENRVKPDVIFVRDDGWSLGAPERFREVAFRLWQSSWVAFITASGEVKPIKDYVR